MDHLARHPGLSRKIHLSLSGIGRKSLCGKTKDPIAHSDAVVELAGIDLVIPFFKDGAGNVGHMKLPQLEALEKHRNKKRKSEKGE
jgi:hypothetical protein